MRAAEASMTAARSLPGRRGEFMTRQDKLSNALLAGALWAIPSALITLALVYLLDMRLLLIPGAIVTFGVAACIMLRDDH